MNDWEQWLAGRPEKVREMGCRYPPGTKFKIHGKIVWLVSYCEDGTVMVSETNPSEAYETAIATRQPICGCCTGKLDEVRIA